MRSSRGFTLIEVILAMTILASMMILVAVSISNATKAKRKIQTELESVSSLRDAMRIIRNDINLAYNHYDFELDILEQSKKKPPAATPPPRQGITSSAVPFAPAAPPEPPSNRKSPATKFAGDESSVNFVTLNNGRTTANEVQADFVEVGYFLKSCQGISGDGGQAVSARKSGGSNCLYRRVQKVIDSDVNKGGLETVLLEDVSEFSLKYLVEGKLDWLKEWKAEKDKGNIFPNAIEVTLAIEKDYDSKKKKYSIQYVVPIHLPNNVKPLSESKSTGGTTTAAPAGGTVTQ